MVFLTDSGTFFQSDCVTRLMTTLVNKHNEMVAACARQRVMDLLRAREVSKTGRQWAAQQRRAINKMGFFK
jgi:hypothetical protein